MVSAETRRQPLTDGPHDREDPEVVSALQQDIRDMTAVLRVVLPYDIRESLAAWERLDEHYPEDE